ncbi:putative LOC100569746 [Trichonephila clavipes]|nr:putative LOC100569746 [Trichonephila clavipes]
MITNFFIAELNNHDVQELWFQQDRAKCHTARATIDLLKDTFGDRLISRFGPVNWPPRSCDFAPLDYFLWGYVKSSVYADKPQTLDHLEDNIRRVISDILPQMLEKVIENWTSRLDYIRSSRGSPMPEIIFKIRQIYRPISKKEQAHHSSTGGKSVSCCLRKADLPKTVARRLRGGGLYARRPVVCIPLTRQHRTSSLQWCREHHNWTEQDWACVLFSDESRFSLSSDCRRELIWRESGTAYNPENIQEKDRYPTCSIMVWAGIMINGRKRLHVVANGTMTGQ